MKTSLVLISILIISAFIFMSCGGGQTVNEERSPGEQAFRSYCQTCHTLPKPSIKTDEQWPALVARYGERAKLSEEKQAEILSYLINAN